MRRFFKAGVIGAAGLLLGAFLMTVTGAFGQSNAGTFSMAAGSDLHVKCANALSNSSVAASSEVVNCAAAAPTTTQPPPTTTPPTTTPPPPPPPPPSGCTSDPQGSLGPFTYSGITNSNGYNTYVSNNEWGANSGTTQTICATDPSSVTLTANGQPADYTGVQTYPDIVQLMNDYCGSDTWNTCPSPTDTPVADLHTLSSNYSVVDPPVSQGDWEAAYDIWVSNNPANNEIMVWVNTSTQRLQDNGAQICNPNVTIGGQSYTYMAYQTCGTGTPQFVLNSNASSGTVDILGVLKYLETQGVEPANMTLGELDFGWEICNTAGQALQFQSSGYTLTAS